MKTYKKTKLWILLVGILSGQVSGYSQNCGESFNKVENGSKLECIQGIHSPINDNNPGYTTYIINHGFHFLTIILKEDKLDELMIGYEGFYNFEEYADNIGSYSVVDSFYLCDLKQDGPHYITFLEEDVQPNGWVTSLITQPEYFCSTGFIESSDRHLTMYEPVAYLPYTAYHHLKIRAKHDKRDYISEFDILSKLKKAEVSTEKTYFHNDHNDDTRRKAFVIKGDKIIIDYIMKDWVKVAYEGEKVTTEGWLKRTDIKILD